MEINPIPSNCVVPTAYFPSIAWMSTFWAFDEVHLEAYENYQKGGYRNRCKIATANGTQWLTIPLTKGKHQRTPVREVCIDETLHWRTTHWRTIQSAYGQSPFFIHYIQDLAQAWHTETDNLWTWNLTLIEVMRTLLHAPKTPLTTTQTYEKTLAENTDLRQSLPQANTSAQWPKYSQVFEHKYGFLANLSCLDLLFCVGPSASQYLKSVSEILYSPTNS